MLTAAHRIRSGDDYRRVFRAGIRVRSEHLMAHSLRETDDSHAVRVGFIVSRAVGNAVVRNRVKRRLREIMRVRLDELAPGTLFVIRALPQAGESEFAVLESEVETLLTKAGKKLAGRGRRT
ncbi:ribonuclease P protein component [Brevibacterium sp. GP-SGM9]|uniref:ribonuclease P protein component n=1 Tax=unclassified Brevibacterium TaxID=2614124 RepID=UPI001E477127|nr:MULTISPECIES: ribonuclease P protein component [unclassified Brevibacterium]MCD1286371.1 ribonuclease P protein component [Brevibacterium sp. CCUG 69071]MDK8433738.1 ribonuclease P protein component [Brevibacterium sp. H-BE7]